MSNFHKILCPVDLSKNSMAAIKLATTLAKESKSKVVFMYVTPLWLPEENFLPNDYVLTTMEKDKRNLERIRPTDPEVEFEHVIAKGNAGPEIVKQSKICDSVVMSTHGYGAVMRLLMGSVAQYVVRHAKCPVIMFRNSQAVQSETDQEKTDKHYITEVMHQVTPVRENDEIEDVLQQLEQARETAAPVVNEAGECVGILTKTDIDHYRQLVKRFEAKDPSVVDEMFETDKFGQRRPRNVDFPRVKRHMSSPVITISNNETTAKAAEVFAQDKKIHHLVVVDDANHAVGIIEPDDCEKHLNVDVTVKPAASSG